jgi:hypothetical protein
MTAYIKGQPFKPQAEDVNGNPLALGTVEFYIWNTTTPTPYYTDAIGTSGGTSLTLDILGKPANDIFYSSSITYKIITKDAAGTVIDTLGPYSVSLPASDMASPDGANQIGFDGDTVYDPGTIGYPLRNANPVVRMVRGSTTSDWIVFDPHNEPIDISASTTSGLQEAINYACTGGYNLEVQGGATTTAGGGLDYGLLFCDASITFPAMRATKITFNAVHLIFNTVIASGDGVIIDSCMMVDFDFCGEIVHLGSGVPLRFKPTNPPGVDPLRNVVDSRFNITTVVASNGAPACVIFDISLHSLTNTKYSFRELNGAGGGTKAAIGIIVSGADSGANREFTQNIIEATHIHDVTSACIQVGLNATNADNYYGNLYFISGMSTDGATAAPFDTFGNYDTALIGVMGGASQYGAVFQSSAIGNTVSVGYLTGNTGLDVNDLGSANSFSYNGKKYLGTSRASVTLGGTNQTGIVTATWTKVTFNTEIYDKGAKYDSTTNYRWTPGQLGEANIRARVGWVSMADASIMRIAVYKNGVIYKGILEGSSGTLTGQGPAINVIVPITAVTDYFEIFVRQETGGNRDIDGALSDSWASFEMMP